MMTYYEMNKELNNLRDALAEVTYTDHPYIGKAVRCEGHGVFVETNELVVKHRHEAHPVLTGADREAALRRVAELEALTADERARRAEAAKAKRYRKELAELIDRKAYLERWLAEHER